MGFEIENEHEKQYKKEDSSIGSFIRELRESKKLSQREFAKMAGLSNAEIHRIEHGVRQQPSPDVLKTISLAFEVPYEELLEKASFINSYTSDDTTDAGVAKIMAILMPKLILEGWTVGSFKYSTLGDILATKGDANWVLDIRYFKPNEGKNNSFRNIAFAEHFLTQSYGKLSMNQKTKIDKFTTVTNNEKMFHEILEKPPVNLRIDISVVLVDLEEGVMVCEVGV
ncbi:MAG: helix-turn-helix transcriptional regulator [Bacillota bacterium]